MRVPSSQVRIQICKCVVSFYNMELPRKLLSGYQPTSANYKIQMSELGGLAETLVLSLALVENKLTEKLWVLKALQHLSSSGVNCRLMMKAQAASRLCLYLNGVDSSGQLLFRSSEILWNLLENTSKEEVVNQLSSLECVHALKEVFVDLLMHGFRHYDRQLRNDLLVITTLLAENPAAPMIESGFTELLIALATFTEVKIPNPLVKGLKLTYSYEDFELKKLLFNVIGVLSKDPCAVQLLSESDVMPALLYYVKPNQKPGFHDWSAAQYEELQLHAIAILASVAPLLVDKYLSCQANTLLLVFLEWCIGQDPFFGQGNSFHGTGGRGNKLAQMRYSLRVLRSVVSLYDDAVNLNLCDQGAISQLLDILKYAANKTKEKEDAILLEIQADILFLLSVLCENDHHRKLKQRKNLYNVILGILVEFCDNPKTTSHISTWRGEDQTAASLLIQLWREEELELGVKRDRYGRIVDMKRPIASSFQKQRVIPMPANCPSFAIMEISENIRAKLYSLLCKLGFENLPGLSPKDFVTLAIIQHYVDFKVGEVWSEICAELKEEFKPIASDDEALKVISEISENTGRMVAALQTEVLESQHHQEIQEEEKTCAKIQAIHTQREMINKSWENFLTRTSNYEALKKAKRLQEKSVEASRSKFKIQNGAVCSTDFKGLNTTIGSGRLVTVESTPSQLIGGPVALRKPFKRVKILDSVEKDSRFRRNSKDATYATCKPTDSTMAVSHKLMRADYLVIYIMREKKQSETQSTTGRTKDCQHTPPENQPRGKVRSRFLEGEHVRNVTNVPARASARNALAPLGSRCFGGRGGLERGADTLHQTAPVPGAAGGSLRSVPTGTAPAAHGGQAPGGRHSPAPPGAGRAAHAHLRGTRSRLAPPGCQGGCRQEGSWGVVCSPGPQPHPGGLATDPAPLPSSLHTPRASGAAAAAPARLSPRRRPGPGVGGGCQHGAVRRGGAAEATRPPRRRPVGAGQGRGAAPRRGHACLRGRRGPAVGQSLAPSRGVGLCRPDGRAVRCRCRGGNYGNFIDDLRLYVRGGTGGMGYPRLGGEGGRGGDVWFVAQERTTLKSIRDRYPQKRFVAGTGANSSVQALKGEKGKDCEVHVPLGISVLCDDGKQIGELNAAGERFLAARGGLGGSLATNFVPCKGQKRIVRLDLKLIADVGLVGFPNAGKSSLLSKISHAKPEIANYAFTTIQPELGKIMYADYKQISVADLPGLIEGAHANKGMGHKFLKHVERTKQLLLVVDVSGFQLSIKTQFRTAFETILLLTKELELYKDELLTKPALLAINKMDLPGAKDDLNELMKQLQNPQDFLHVLQEEVIPANTLEFKDIIPISTYTGEGIEELKACIRKSVDEEAEKENEEYRKKKLLLLQTSEERMNRS
ncbi:LOW QUALITY PROTEIN: cilia- and flagella-associated protein 69 [Pterocles gutturalis]